MPDKRIQQILQAAEAMSQGAFFVEVPVGEDEIGRLGHAVQTLGILLEQRYRELRILTQVTEKINAGLLLDEVLESVYESFRPIIPYHRIGLALLEQDDQIVRTRWARSDFPEVRLGDDFSLPLAETSLARVLDSGEARILNDLEEYLQQHPDSTSTRLLLEEGMLSSLTCPLIAMGHPIGFIFFTCRYTNAYQTAHVDLFREIAGQLSIIVEKSRLYERLLTLNEEKNRLLGVAAHDLRNPIGVAQGYLKLVLAGTVGPLNPAQRKLLERVERSSLRMLNLVNDLLDVSAIESGRLNLDLEEVELEPYLAEVLETSALLAAEKSITLLAEVQRPLPRVRLDRRRFDQVLHNLLTNAVKFSQSGTIITLGARTEPHAVQIFVQDQGQGLCDEELGRVFKALARGSTRPAGDERSTGMGLAISSRIVEAHGGSIAVQSNPGEGARFIVTLPLSHPASS
ncbi:MAG: ATP-binding protein [Candidatus Xenobium sp.]|jgi:signal transduction histidine kinase|nr:GAF domain-containing protein [Burkholderiales bacterium]